MSPHVRSTYSPLPRELSVALKYQYHDRRDSNTTPSAYVFGLFEYLNQKPMFSSELFNMYRLCRVTAVHIKAEIINLSSTVPLILSVGTLPWSSATSTFDPYLIAERPRAVSRTVATSTGMSRAIINKTYFSFDELGNPVYDAQHYFDSVQAGSSTPQDQEAPCVIVSVGAADSTSTWTGLTTYTVTYHVQYFELQWADFSMSKERERARAAKNCKNISKSRNRAPPEDCMEEYVSDDESSRFVEPSLKRTQARAPPAKNKIYSDAY
jgi:hypothetical protein